MTLQLILGALVALVLTFLLALAESAVQRVSRHTSEELLDEGRAGAASLVKVVEDKPGYISAATFLRVISESTMAVLVTVAVAERVDGPVRPLLISIAIMAVASFVLTGVSPRTLGRQHAGRVAVLAAPALVWLRRVLGPVARLMVGLGNAVTPGKGYTDGPFATEAELRDLVDMANQSDVIEDDEREMIHSVFELGDTVAREVMVPRTDMVTLEQDKTLGKAMSLFLRSGFSRIPVVGEDNDDVLGLLYLKDVARRVNDDEPARALPVEDVMRPMHFVPDSKPIDDLLREMQQDQVHLAVVVDEYGGTAGLVTIEDILEEIVGEIADEYDREAQGIEELGDGSVRIPATMHVDDFAQEFGVDLEEDDVDTVGGLIAKLSGRVPIPGSTVQLLGLELMAEKPAGRRHRIATVVVRRVAQDRSPVEVWEAELAGRRAQQDGDASRHEEESA
ncbi:hemolysin family protein [Arsenicicoccus sp. oral taxon 190]|uniref:hemolysin family protein n=1 Tax=Arsenicicoccus sp. oral taxon 190 TaxID=1658671 RepID=UPI000AF8E940|nr:hemolysin family protein [Arsenicicoccus sp. oral taxon 190]